jgi:hypothetical protein
VRLGGHGVEQAAGAGFVGDGEQVRPGCGRVPQTAQKTRAAFDPHERIGLGNLEPAAEGGGRQPLQRGGVGAHQVVGPR